MIFLVSTDQMVPVMIPFEYISVFRYALEAAAVNEYNGLTLSCQPSWDPIRDLKISDNLSTSMIATAWLALGFFITSFAILWLRSRKSV